jgi:hypothetical protein
MPVFGKVRYNRIMRKCTYILIAAVMALAAGCSDTEKTSEYSDSTKAVFAAVDAANAKMQPSDITPELIAATKGATDLIGEPWDRVRPLLGKPDKENDKESRPRWYHYEKEGLSIAVMNGEVIRVEPYETDEDLNKELDQFAGQ